MGFRAIDSEEVVATPSMMQGAPPQHVDPEHVKCAFYVQLGDIIDPRDPLPLENYHGPISPFIEMECPHGTSGGGAWYSEDYVRQLREAVQKLINVRLQKASLINMLEELSR